MKYRNMKQEKLCGLIVELDGKTLIYILYMLFLQLLKLCCLENKYAIVLLWTCVVFCILGGVAK